MHPSLWLALKKGVGLAETFAMNYLVPKHEIVPKEKQEEVLKKFGMTTRTMPRIHKADPIIEEIKAEKGDIIKITRRSHTAGVSIYFRIVV